MRPTLRRPAPTVKDGRRGRAVTGYGATTSGISTSGGTLRSVVVRYMRTV
jgi:hypothetical protein